MKMGRRDVMFSVLAIVIAAIVATYAGRFVREADAAPNEPMREPAAGATPVLVELFTSEGCSSCPPADAVLARLERTQPVNGARVVPLALHVDYWDRLGWTDPFSGAAWTARQHSYAPLGGGNYTPQAVVDGRFETVGSRSAAIEKAIADAVQRPHASIAIDVTEKSGAFTIALTIGALPSGAASDAEAIIAITQATARVAVPKGENAGSTLEHTAIARELRVVGAVPVQGGKLETTMKAQKDMRVVAFVQERASRKILGTGTRVLAP
jgi:hypothetical protein